MLLAPSIGAQQPDLSRTPSILQIRVVEGDGAVHRAGARTNRGLVVQVTDETGRPVSGAAVSFRMPEEGPTGIFSSGMATEVVTTTPDGRAAIFGMQWNRAAGPFQIRITAVAGELRSGTVSPQYLSDSAPVGELGPFRKKGSSRKWVILTAVAGGVAAGILAASSGGSAPAAAGPPASAPPSIGTPSISVSRP